MEIGEIISDAIMYPINNIKAMVIYVVLGIVASIILTLTGVGVGVGVAANNGAAIGIVGVIGLIIALIIGLLIIGYELDVVKFGIERRDDSPDIDFARQVTNGIKLYITIFVYLLIPLVIMALLRLINDTLGAIIGLILIIIAGFALSMAQCRLASTDSLGEALNIPEAIKDITRVGIVKIIAVGLIIIILAFVLLFIIGIIGGIFGQTGMYIAAIISGILYIYLMFVAFRASGLLYSDVA